MFNNLISVIEAMGLKKHDCHPELPRDKEFSGLGLGGGAISLEEALFIQGVIAVVKPDIVIELGTSAGGSSVAIGAMLKDFGKGELYTIDLAENPPPAAFEMVEKFELPVNFVNDTHSIDYLSRLRVDETKIHLVFSDTDIPVRPKEVDLVMEKFPQGTYVLVHDTSDKHPFGPMKLNEALGGAVDIIEMPSPRGISLLKV